MEENISLVKKKQKKFAKKVEEVKEQVKSTGLVHSPTVKPKRTKPEHGLVYVGHIPHGFYENEMQAYFRQFGKVSSVRVCRSRRTGRSKGYAFVEFANDEVAKIAAETMDNYLMFNRRLVAKHVPIRSSFKRRYKGPVWSAKNCPRIINRKKSVLKKNKNVDDAAYLKSCEKMITVVNRSLKKLHELGINYRFKAVDVPEGITKQIVQPVKRTASDVKSPRKKKVKGKRKLS